MHTNILLRINDNALQTAATCMPGWYSYTAVDKESNMMMFSSMQPNALS